MDQDIYALSAQYAAAALRNSASTIYDKIHAIKARKRDNETIAQMEEIISELLSDKAELLRIAQTYDEALVAQRISAAEVRYISDNILPVLADLLKAAGTGDDQTLQTVKRLLSVETVTILQLIGFNFTRAIGEPLTELLASAIRSRISVPSLRPSSSPQKPRR